MAVDRDDMRTFLNEVFKKEYDPGSLTMRMLRESYCAARNISPSDFTKEQRHMFSKVVDVMFNDYAKAQEFNMALEQSKQKAVVAKKRAYERNLSDGDFLPKKLSKKPQAKQSLEFSEEEFQPKNVGGGTGKHMDRRSEGDVMDSFIKLDQVETEDVCVAMEPQICDRPSSDEEVLKSESLDGANVNSSDIHFNPKSKENSNSSSQSSSADRRPKCTDSSNLPDNPSGVQFSSGKPLRSILVKTPESKSRDEPSLSGKSDLPDPLSSDDEFQPNATKKNLDKVVSDVEGSKHDSASSDELPLVNFSRAKSEEGCDKPRNGHKSVIEHSPPKYLKTKKLRKTGSKRPRKAGRDASENDFSSTDDEPLAGLKDTVTGAKEKPIHESSGDEENSNIGSAADDSDEFENKEKRKKRARESSSEEMQDSPAFKKKKGKSKDSAWDSPSEKRRDSDLGQLKRTKLKMKNAKGAAKKWESDDDTESRTKTQMNDDNDPKLTRMKQLIRTAGLRVRYQKVFMGCRSIKSKIQAMTSLLHEAGLRGRPSVAKCKKLRVQRETQKEVAELDRSNILGNTEGRTRRVTRTAFSTSPSSPPVDKTAKLEISSDSSAKQMFKRLQEIVDSEESNGD